MHLVSKTPSSVESYDHPLTADHHRESTAVDQSLEQAIVLAIDQLAFGYPDRQNVLCDVSVKICKGERIGLIGHNGCGKTTLFLLICGLLTPSRGTISLFNQPVIPGQFRSEIGLLFQNPDDQLFSPSVREDISFGPQNMGLSPEEVEARVNTVLALIGIQPLAERPPHHLSGGEKQMAAIAGLLAMAPQMILYDEPTASLDLRNRRRLIQFLQQSPETLLISSHDLEFILEVCDRVLLIDQGYVVADGNPGDIMTRPDLMEAHGLEIPHSLRH